MYKYWIEMTNTLSAAMGRTRKAIPEVGKAFSALAAAATAKGALDTKTKDLVALAIGIAVRRDGCIGFHAKTARLQGASREEVLEIVALAICMGPSAWGHLHGRRPVLRLWRAGPGGLRPVPRRRRLILLMGRLVQGAATLSYLSQIPRSLRILKAARR